MGGDPGEFGAGGVVSSGEGIYCARAKFDGVEGNRAKWEPCGGWCAPAVVRMGVDPGEGVAAGADEDNRTTLAEDVHRGGENRGNIGGWVLDTDRRGRGVKLNLAPS